MFSFYFFLYIYNAVLHTRVDYKIATDYSVFSNKHLDVYRVTDISTDLLSLPVTGS